MKTIQIAKSNQPQTLRLETCVCDKVCTLLFDGRKIVGGDGTEQNIPKCWNKGADFLVTRVERHEAEIDQIMEKAYEVFEEKITERIYLKAA